MLEAGTTNVALKGFVAVMNAQVTAKTITTRDFLEAKWTLKRTLVVAAGATATATATAWVALVCR